MPTASPCSSSSDHSHRSQSKPIFAEQLGTMCSKMAQENAIEDLYSCYPVVPPGFEDTSLDANLLSSNQVHKRSFKNMKNFTSHNYTTSTCVHGHTANCSGIFQTFNKTAESVPHTETTGTNHSSLQFALLNSLKKRLDNDILGNATIPNVNPFPGHENFQANYKVAQNSDTKNFSIGNSGGLSELPSIRHPSVPRLIPTSSNYSFADIALNHHFVLQSNVISSSASISSSANNVHYQPAGNGRPCQAHIFNPQPQPPHLQRNIECSSPTGFPAKPMTYFKSHDSQSEDAHKNQQNYMSRPLGVPPLHTSHTHMSPCEAHPLQLVEHKPLLDPPVFPPLPLSQSGPPGFELLLSSHGHEGNQQRSKQHEKEQRVSSGRSGFPPLPLLRKTIAGLTTYNSNLPSSTAIITVDDVVLVRDEGECIPICSHPNLDQVPQIEDDLLQATEDTFYPSVVWTEDVLADVVTFELQHMCVQNDDRWRGIRDQQQVVDQGHQSSTHEVLSHPSDGTEMQQERLFHCFTSQRRQQFKLFHYIEKLVSSANCSASTFIVMLAYIDRLQQRRKCFQINRMNVRLVVLAALLVAVKFVDDVVYSKAHYASIGGVGVKKLNQLEFTFCQSAKWSFFVTAEDYKTYEKGLLQCWTRTDAQGECVVMPRPV